LQHFSFFLWNCFSAGVYRHFLEKQTSISSVRCSILKLFKRCFKVFIYELASWITQYSAMANKATLDLERDDTER